MDGAADRPSSSVAARAIAIGKRRIESLLRTSMGPAMSQSSGGGSIIRLATSAERVDVAISEIDPHRFDS
jgi:hypothetical protein